MATDAGHPHPSPLRGSVISNAQPPPPPTTPLRIAKRDSTSALTPRQQAQGTPGQPGVARRQSSSYNHLRKNNLVSKSPFKSQIPTPGGFSPDIASGSPSAAAGISPRVPFITAGSPRRVSGEKRARPLSMQAAAENEHPPKVGAGGLGAYQRARRQSRGIAVLDVLEPVTKSPFRRTPSDEHPAQMGPPPVPPKFAARADEEFLHEQEHALHQSQLPRDLQPAGALRPSISTTAIPSGTQPSPTRSSLVSRRLHGPRVASGHGPDAFGRRHARRKTVTFDERCDVVEFDRESCEFATSDEDVFESDVDMYEHDGEGDDHDGYFGGGESEVEYDLLGAPHPSPQRRAQGGAPVVSDSDSYVSFSASDGELDSVREEDENEAHGEGGDDSIVGLVDSMLQDALDAPQTPTHDEHQQQHTPVLPPGLSGGHLDDEENTERGAPLGRTHHAQRGAAAHAQAHAREQAHRQSVLGLGVAAIGHVRPADLFSASPSSTPSAPFASGAVPSTPPRHASPALGAGRTSVPEDVAGALSPGSHLPLGRTTHAERLRAQRTADARVDADVRRLPDSPSPRKVGRSLGAEGLGGSMGIPKFGIANLNRDDEDGMDGADPFALPRNTNHKVKDEPTDDADLLAPKDEQAQAHGTLAASASSLVAPAIAALGLGGGSPMLSAMLARFGSPFGGGAGAGVLPAQVQSVSSNMPVRVASPRVAPVASPIPAPARASPFQGAAARMGSNSPAPESTPSSLSSTDGGRPSSLASSTTLGSVNMHMRTGTGSLLPASGSGIGLGFIAEATGSTDSLTSASTGTPTGTGPRRRSPRISREDVHKRLLKKRSMESPLRELGAEELGFAERVQQELEHDQAGGLAPSSMDGRGSMVSSTGSDLPEATIERAEKRAVGSPVLPAPGTPTLRMERHRMSHDGVLERRVEDEGLPRPAMHARAATFDGLGVQDEEKEGRRLSIDMRSALDRLLDDVASESEAGGSVKGSSIAGSLTGRMTLEAVTEGVRAGRFDIPAVAEEDSREEDDEEDSMDVDDDDQDDQDAKEAHREGKTQEPVALLNAFQPTPGGPSRSVSGSTIPPPPPPKDAIRIREELILEKRREARRREEDQAMGRATPPRDSRPLNADVPKPKKSGRPSARRSLSTGDADDVFGARRRDEEEAMLDFGEMDSQAAPLADSIARELQRRDGPLKSKYYVHERQETIYASTDAECVVHSGQAGDINAGKAWKPVRRPSDMNEYSKQIKAFQAQEMPGKAHGKVFVRVVGARRMNLPFPHQPTAVTCTLNNGIHYVTTPECRLAKDCAIGQEFELIEHSKLEFTLTLKVRRDPHIIQQFKANTPPVAPPPQPVAAPAPAPKGGMRSFFKGSPKKAKPSPASAAQPPPQPQWKLEDNLARHLKSDGTLARAFVSFKDVAHRCDTRLAEIVLPLVGQRSEPSGKVSTIQVGELVLEMFRLPPLPVPSDQLPQSLEDCHRGLRHVAWHKVTYFEGTLTQNGGDCTSWRRRHLRVVGAHLVAFNDVTKKATASIDLRKAVAVEDDDEVRGLVLSPSSGSTGRSSKFVDDFDGPGVGRAFRLIFPENQEISFFADTDEEKDRWLEVLRALVGHIPPNPLWAELLWQRQQDLVKQQQSVATQSSSSRPENTRAASAR